MKSCLYDVYKSYMQYSKCNEPNHRGWYSQLFYDLDFFERIMCHIDKRPYNDIKVKNSYKERIREFEELENFLRIC